jgi:hypothetical protein
MLVSLRTATTALLGLLSVPAVSAYTNPIRNPGGSDPQIVWSGGYYYLLSTTWTDVQIARADTVAGLKTAEKKVVYSTTEASRACNVWAPEVHYLGGAWYVYYTAGNCDDLGGQRLHVLRGGATPWDEYSYAAQLSTEWAIDASVLRFAEHGNFLVFSCFHGGLPNQSTCLYRVLCIVLLDARLLPWLARVERRGRSDGRDELDQEQPVSAQERQRQLWYGTQQLLHESERQRNLERVPCDEQLGRRLRRQQVRHGAAGRVAGRRTTGFRDAGGAGGRVCRAHLMAVGRGECCRFVVHVEISCDPTLGTILWIYNASTSCLIHCCAVLPPPSAYEQE